MRVECLSEYVVARGEADARTQQSNTSGLDGLSVNDGRTRENGYRQSRANKQRAPVDHAITPERDGQDGAARMRPIAGGVKTTESGNALVAVRKSWFDDDVASVKIAVFAQSIAECVDAGDTARPRGRRQVADPGYRCRLLRVGGKRDSCDREDVIASSPSLQQPGLANALHEPVDGVYVVGVGELREDPMPGVPRSSEARAKGHMGAEYLAGTREDRRQLLDVRNFAGAHPSRELDTRLVARPLHGGLAGLDGPRQCPQFSLKGSTFLNVQPAWDKTDDYRHLLESARCDVFVTDDRNLARRAPELSPFRPTISWQDLYERLS
jgi:hypothetical protein